MKQSISKIELFKTPYEIYSYREATQEESMENFQSRVKDKVIKTINTPLKAAKHMAQVGADNALQNHINDVLDKSVELKNWQNAMPSCTPKSLSDYQKNYPNYDLESLEDDIQKYGVLAPDEQYLFHGGKWADESKNIIILDKPFSTSFCPQIAFRNAEHKGKAFDCGSIDLFVLKVKNPKTKAFLFKRKGTRFGHENEVLFNTGLILKLVSKEIVRIDYPAYKAKGSGIDVYRKLIPVNILEVEIS